eukprot:scaffold156109_cov35-Tisochrysis_lutea.AAC.5
MNFRLAIGTSTEAHRGPKRWLPEGPQGARGPPEAVSPLRGSQIAICTQDAISVLQEDWACTMAIIL